MNTPPSHIRENVQNIHQLDGKNASSSTWEQLHSESLITETRERIGSVVLQFPKKSMMIMPTEGRVDFSELAGTPCSVLMRAILIPNNHLSEAEAPYTSISKNKGEPTLEGTPLGGDALVARREAKEKLQREQEIAKGIWREMQNQQEAKRKESIEELRATCREHAKHDTELRVSGISKFSQGFEDGLISVYSEINTDALALEKVWKTCKWIQGVLLTNYERALKWTTGLTTEEIRGKKMLWTNSLYNAKESGIIPKEHHGLLHLIIETYVDGYVQTLWDMHDTARLDRGSHRSA